jgi:hypothetical protein
MTTVTESTPTSKRLVRRLDERVTEWLAPPRRPGPASVRAVLGAVAPDTERVYVTGPRPGGGVAGFRQWATPTDGLLPGWRVHERGHYLEGEHPVLRFVRPDGRRLEVLRAAVYFGEGDYRPAVAAAAWDLLRRELAADFPHVRLLSSPSATGRELMLHSFPRDTEWPTLPDDLQQWIRATSGQGRIEICEPRARRLAELVEYDGRLMYGALCWGLPGRGGRHVRTDDYLGQVRARYYAHAMVPRDWDTRCACGAPGHRGIGLLPYAPPDDTGWYYPARPGHAFAGWWDGAEIHVALRHGWQFRFHTALVFDPYTGRGPLDDWSQRLIATRRRIDLYRPHGGDQGVVAELAARAVRSILLHAIGGLHGTAQRTTHAVPIAEAATVPADARDLRVEGDRLVWAEYGGSGWPELSHPEWSAAIWARARARLLEGPAFRANGGRTGALHVPALHVIAFRTDAIYLAADPHWPDDGRPGRLRHVHTIPGPIDRPTTHTELLEATQ